MQIPCMRILMQSPPSTTSTSRLGMLKRHNSSSNNPQCHHSRVLVNMLVCQLPCHLRRQTLEGRKIHRPVKDPDYTLPIIGTMHLQFLFFACFTLPCLLPIFRLSDGFDYELASSSSSSSQRQIASNEVEANSGTRNESRFNRNSLFLANNEFDADPIPVTCGEYASTDVALDPANNYGDSHIDSNFNDFYTSEEDELDDPPFEPTGKLKNRILYDFLI